MTPKEAYRQFCEKEKEVPIFSQPWFIDAVCGQFGWDILIVKKGDEIAATMPFQIHKKYGFRIPRMPQRVKYWGPYFAKNFRSEKQQQKLTSALIEQFPKFDFFEQNFYPSIQNALPFHWKKFDISVRYTFTIDLSQSLEKIYQNIESNYRNNKIAKAEHLVQITDDRTLEEFYAVQQNH